MTFFDGPLTREPTDATAHRRLGDLHARPVFESFAMLRQGQVGVSLQMPGQPLAQSLALHRWPAGYLHRLDASRLSPPVQPAFDGGAGDPEEF